MADRRFGAKSPNMSINATLATCRDAVQSKDLCGYCHRRPISQVTTSDAVRAALAFNTPGFVTDAFGALLLIPPFRNLIRTVVLTHFLDRKKVWRNGGAPQGHSPDEGGPDEGGGPATIEGKFTVSRSDREPDQ